MARVVFYDRPDSAAAAWQVSMLRRAGHEVEVRNLMAHRWTRDELLRFLGRRPVAEWIDRLSPRVRSGEVLPGGLSHGEALALLGADPSLLPRPLLEVEGRCAVGFLAVEIDRWIGLDPVGSSLPDGPDDAA